MSAEDKFLSNRRSNQKPVKSKLLSIAFASIISALAGMALPGAVGRFHAGVEPAIAAGGGAAMVAAKGLPDFANLAKKLSPAVVNVATTQMRRATQDSPDLGDNRMGEFFERFFGAPLPRGPKGRAGQGSGFIVDSNGTILTNYHVVDGAEKIVVTLADGKNYDANVLGKDKKSDIAVIKINAGYDLPAADFGDSDRLEVGEWVMAIGNPFGLDHTVTSGIVSAKGRNIGAGPYDNFIQTDASINPGNSGGPLINLRGEVVGINTAIFSQSGGNIGIGFAIPANYVKDLLPQLRDKGRVVRGFIGTAVQKVTPEIADSLGAKQARGALIADVVKGGPAEQAGLRHGDIILEFNGRDIKDSADLPIQVARIAPGMSIRVKILRDGKQMTLPLTVGEMKESEVIASTQEGDFGFTVQPVTPQLAEHLGLKRAEGLVITAIERGSAAEEAGLRSGDVITEINRQTVKNLADYRQELARSGEAASVLLLVQRGQSSLFLALKR